MILVVRTMRAASLNVSAVRRFVPALFCLAGMQIVWALASTSPTGVFLAVFNFVVTRIESQFVPDEPPTVAKVKANRKCLSFEPWPPIGN
jgi:hypothetical protein